MQYLFTIYILSLVLAISLYLIMKKQRHWFKEKANSIIIVPKNIWGWVALAVFIFLLIVVAYINFSYTETPLKDSLSFVFDIVLLIGLAGWLFDKKSTKKG